MRKIIGKIAGRTLQRSKPFVPSQISVSGIMQSDPLDSLHRKSDFPSIGEFVTSHEDSLKKGIGLKGKFTSDKKTIDIAEDIFSGATDLDEGGSNFFKRMVFAQPQHTSSEIRSIDVLISDIADFTDLRRKYEKEKIATDGRDVMLCIGGPAAENQVVLAGLIPTHARHGGALNADSNLTGHALLPLILMRNLIGITPEEALDPDYKKIDVPFTIDPTKLRIYFGNEINYWKQKYRESTGKLTEHDINRIESMISQEILKTIEEESGIKISSNAREA